MTPTILVIEDDELLREIYAAKLEMEGFIVQTAANGQEGLEKALKNEPDVILLDMVMPQMTGLQFLEAYQPMQLHPSVTTIIMSNKSTAQDISKAKSFGVLEYLIKSRYTPDEIVEHIRLYLADAPAKSDRPSVG